MQKQLLLGVEAIAQGAIDSGISGVYAYPGTPSTEITEYIQNSKEAIARNVHRAWADGHGIGFRHVLRRQKSLGMYETRRYECGSRLLHECSYYRS